MAFIKNSGYSQPSAPANPGSPSQRAQLALGFQHYEASSESMLSPGPVRILADLRWQVQAGAADGIRCPCCDRLVKSYRRAMNADMARFLILLCREYLAKPPGTFVDIRTIPVRGGDYAKLTHWGLVEQAVNDDPAKRSSGLWRPTPRGLRFAQGEATEPSHVVLLDNEVKGFDEGRVTIWEALGTHFDFEVLWHGEKK
ncbi:MAG: hypothetical protein PHX83_06750 [Acidobacteriia bacterium]|nr:hypothetical protein [Terriglobia bacterium]